MEQWAHGVAAGHQIGCTILDLVRDLEPEAERIVSHCVSNGTILLEVHKTNRFAHGQRFPRPATDLSGAVARWHGYRTS